MGTTVSGNKLSPGEKKSVGLVRALLHDAPILLLDEPTTGLDAGTASLVMNAITEQLEKKRTILCITHQLSTIRRADKVCFFADSTLAEEGTYEELSEKTPVFKNGPQCSHEAGDGQKLCRHCVPASFAAYHSQQ